MIGVACNRKKAGHAILTTIKSGDMDTKQRIMFAFGLLMMLVYWGMAYLLVFSSLFEEKMGIGWRYSMGMVFFIYGSFRAYRQFKHGKY